MSKIINISSPLSLTVTPLPLSDRVSAVRLGRSAT